MTLKIPAQFKQFWNLKNYPQIEFTHAINRPRNIRQIQYMAFSMFMPNFEGYTPDNYNNEFDENEVKIVTIEAAPMTEAEPDAPGSHPPNQFKRLSEIPSILNINEYEDKYGLRCYASNQNIPDGAGFRQQCYGKRDQLLDEYILLEIYVPPYPDNIKFPLMKTTYFTKQYGGLRITWWTHAKHFSRWHDIDQQIWQHIKDWNIASKKTELESK